MSHTVHDKKKLLGRLRRIGGQVAALARVIEGEAECAEVLQQIAAVRGAVNGLMLEVLEGHLREHALGHSSSKDETEQVISIVRAYVR